MAFASILPTDSSSILPESCRCSTTIPVMEEQKQIFDAERAALLVKDLRNNFRSGKTKSHEWRVAQLQSILRMIDENEKMIVEALYEDLGKPELESFIVEISMLKSSCKEALEQLKRWMVPEKVKTSISTYPSSAEMCQNL